MRFIVLLVAAALMVAAGCGEGGDGADAPATTGGDGDQTTSTSAGGGPLALELAEPGPLVTGEPVTWSLTLTNTSAEAVSVRFSTSQRADVVLSRGGEEVYRWSGDRVFAQVLGEETLQPGESSEYELEEPALGVEPGTYQLLAEITGRPAPAPVQRTVEVQPA